MYFVSQVFSRRYHMLEHVRSVAASINCTALEFELLTITPNHRRMRPRTHTI